MCYIFEMETRQVNMWSALCNKLYVVPPNLRHTRTLVHSLHVSGGVELCMFVWVEKRTKNMTVGYASKSKKNILFDLFLSFS